MIPQTVTFEDIDEIDKLVQYADDMTLVELIHIRYKLLKMSWVAGIMVRRGDRFANQILGDATDLHKYVDYMINYIYSWAPEPL